MAASPSSPSSLAAPMRAPAATPRARSATTVGAFNARNPLFRSGARGTAPQTPPRLAELRDRVRAACASARGGDRESSPAKRATTPLSTPRRRASAALLRTPTRAPYSSPSSSSPSFLTPPVLSERSVDHELWAALDVCLDDELEAVDQILHSGGAGGPLLKTLSVVGPSPGGGGGNGGGGGAGGAASSSSSSSSSSASVARDGRAHVMHRVEARLRFLAADARATLAGESPSYREALLDLRDALGAPGIPRHLSTPDLEAELLAHALEQQELGEAREGRGPGGDGPGWASSGETSSSSSPSPPGGRARGQQRGRDGGPHAAVRAWAERLASRQPPPSGAASLLGGGLLGVGGAGGAALARTLAKLGGALTVSAAGQSAVGLLARQFLATHLRSQAATAVGSAAAASAAQRAVVLAAARYSALRGALALLGPALWGALALDLALRALGADHARVARAVFVLAQVRLVRTGGFAPPPPPPVAAAPAPPAAASSSPSAAFSERLYGPLRPDGARGGGRRPGSAAAAAVPAEFVPLGSSGGSSSSSSSSSGSGEDEVDEDDEGGGSGGGGGGGGGGDDDEDDLWLYGIA